MTTIDLVRDHAIDGIPASHATVGLLVVDPDETNRFI